MKYSSPIEYVKYHSEYTKNMTPARRKTLVYFGLSLALVAVAAVWVDVGTSFAQTAPAPKPPSPVLTAFKNTASTIATNLGNAAMGVVIVHGVLYILYGLFIYGLGLVGTFLDYFYILNLIAAPSTNVVVFTGWTILRDLANGLFILLILWVAITIIFNLETLGGKRLLVRIIVVALLINFSLLMVTAVFAFANQLARPFARALNLDPFTSTTSESSTTGISDIIIRNTKIQTVAQIAKDTGVVEELARNIKPAQTSPQTQSTSLASYWIATIRQSLGGPQPIPAVQAGPVDTINTGLEICTGVGALLGWTIVGAKAALICGSLRAATYTAGAILSSWGAGGSGGVIGWEIQNIINLAVADFFLGLTAISLLTVAILLATRLVAMMFIGVFAPIAFLGLVVPRYGEKIWNMWLDNLFRWAFVAPIFYFLLYLALIMLETISTAQVQFPSANKVAFQGNALYILSLVIFLTFLWAAIFLTRKAAGMGAEAALTFGKKLAGVGLGLGTGLAARWALPAAGRFATRLQEKINQGSPLLRSTFGRGLTAYGLRRVTKAGRQQILDAQARINASGETSAEIQQGLASGRYRGDVNVAAAVGVLRSRGDLDPQAGVRDYGERHLTQAANVFRGLKTDIVPLMRANPTIATQADFDPRQFDTTGSADNAINRVLAAAGRTGATPTADDTQHALELLAWERVRPQDMDTIDTNLLKGSEADKKNNRRRFLETATGPHFSRLANRDTGAAREVQAELDADIALWNSFSDKKKEYFYSSAAAAIGIWRAPPGATRSSAFSVLHRNFNATARAGAAYASTPLVSGGSGAYTATLVSGSLPTGLSIDNTGRIIGNVDTTIPPGTSFRAEYDIDDGSGSPQRVTINITIT